jgi:hypothetical protein
VVTDVYPNIANQRSKTVEMARSDGCMFGRCPSQMGIKKVSNRYIQNGEGIKIHPSKVKAIVDWERPTTGKEVRRFMGTANWQRKLVKNIPVMIAIPVMINFI